MHRKEAANFEKRITVYGSNERGLFTHVIDPASPFLTKTAGEYHPTVAAYIRNAKPIPGVTQILLTALGAGEYWGDNANSDYFPESELAYEGPEYGYKTFETTAKVFKHHINKPDSPSYGKVALSIYNPKMHRVELIVHVDQVSGADIISRVDKGETTEWSMGCRIPYDVCSVCGNRAPKREFYCFHLKVMMGTIDPESGKKVYAINIRPKFFDISYVLVGADRIAKTLMKVASQGSAMAKRADMEKLVPADNPPASAINIEKLKALAESFAELKQTEAAIPNDLLDRLVDGTSLRNVLSTMALMGIVPKPEEFQRMFLKAQGEAELAEKLSSLRVCFDPASVTEPTREDFRKIGLDFRHFDDTIMARLSPFAESRSSAAPHLGTRFLGMVKGASQVAYPPPRYVRVGPGQDQKGGGLGVLPILLAAAGAYAALSHAAPQAATVGLDAVLASPGGAALAAILGISMLNKMTAPSKQMVRGQYTLGQYENPDRTDVFSRIEEMKSRPYTKVGSVGAAAKRVFIGVPAAYMASGVLQSQALSNHGYEEGPIKSFVRQHPEAVAGLMVADGLLSAGGGGSHRFISKLTKTAEPFSAALQKASEASGSEEFSKIAGSDEFISQAITWPLAIGKANLPGRMIGGLFDQAIIESASQWKKRRDRKKANRAPTLS